MRKFLIAAAALGAISAPAFAQPYEPREPVPYEEDFEGEFGEEDAFVLDPAEIARMAGVMDRMLGAIMNLPIGGIAEAVDPLGRSGIGRGDTLRDVAGREDPFVEQRIRAGIQGATSGLGAISKALTRMMPALRRSLDEVSRSFEDAMAEVDAGRPY